MRRVIPSLLAIIFLAYICGQSGPSSEGRKGNEPPSQTRTPQPKVANTRVYVPTSTKINQIKGCLGIGALNVRSGPGIGHPIIGGMESGDCVSLDARDSTGGVGENLVNKLEGTYPWVGCCKLPDTRGKLYFSPAGGT
jgi:hypothetical protein